MPRADREVLSALDGPRLPVSEIDASGRPFWHVFLQNLSRLTHALCQNVAISGPDHGLEVRHRLQGPCLWMSRQRQGARPTVLPRSKKVTAC